MSKTTRRIVIAAAVIVIAATLFHGCLSAYRYTKHSVATYHTDSVRMDRATMCIGPCICGSGGAC